jgi:hypothetical protein
MAYSDDVLALSPWLYWRFEETAGGTAEDSSPNNRDGTISGATLNQAGKVGTAFSFDGIDDRVTGATNFTALTAFTAVCWVYFTAAPSTTVTLTSTATTGTGTHDRELLLNTSRQAQALVWDGVAERFTSLGSALATDTWHMLAMREDGTNLKVFHNGGTEYGTIGCTTATDSVPVQVATDTHAYGPFSGRVDEVAWFTTSLSTANLNTLYTSAQVTGSPTVDWSDFPKYKMRRD